MNNKQTRLQSHTIKDEVYLNSKYPKFVYTWKWEINFIVSLQILQRVSKWFMRLSWLRDGSFLIYFTCYF